MEKILFFSKWIKNPPYGYRRENGSLQIDPTDSETVKRIFREALSGKGSHAIATELNQDGIKPRRSKSWSQDSVYDILRNETYVRDTLNQKTFTYDEYRRHKNRNYKYIHLFRTSK